MSDRERAKDLQAGKTKMCINLTDITLSITSSRKENQTGQKEGVTNFLANIIEESRNVPWPRV